MKIGERLKEERARLGFNQAEFAAFAGVAKTSQFNYEKGERSPDAAYLAAVAEKGVDILYVVTGERRPVPADSVLADEMHLLEFYREMAHDDRQSLVRMAYALAKAGGTA
ncbi:helix-turn-helix transcriptional regulator [Pseudomonas sp. MSSRFD41]|uniref:helix-turn-helix domain-containing protein n=1 Tax=Pseudomonas sp. MSSRFD41 TaxID=1310370 RepID=UPI00163A41AC|nr:helix-turn-helix transcriptional regulator [Pseudomonas sp. MSSRFD41]MBC2660011.1 helix-turn-helix transcriptional regulator [Pseudomonas sp. MSSRFD41]